MPRELQMSVIVAVHDSSTPLGEVLRAIRSSKMPRDSYEVIVIDDVNTEDSRAIAARYADKVMRLTGPKSGPAYARNRGVEIARGEVVAFVSGDVIVRPDTFPRMLATFTARADVDAISASHDEQSCAPNFVSQYWNLLLRFGEERYPGRNAHFAAGCGAVRRDVLVSTGMYDEWRFVTAGVENMDLGQRLYGAGHGVLLDCEIKVTHLKCWTLGSVCREVWCRSTLLARSLGYQRTNSAVPGEVVFTLGRALTPALAVVLTLTLAAAFLPEPHAVGKWAIIMAALLLTNLPAHRFYKSARGIGFALASAPIHILMQFVAGVALCNGWILRDVFGDVLPDAATQAYSEVGLEIWPPVRRRL